MIHEIIHEKVSTDILQFLEAGVELNTFPPLMNVANKMKKEQ